MDEYHNDDLPTDEAASRRRERVLWYAIAVAVVLLAIAVAQLLRR